MIYVRKQRSGSLLIILTCLTASTRLPEWGSLAALMKFTTCVIFIIFMIMTIITMIIVTVILIITIFIIVVILFLLIFTIVCNESSYLVVGHT